MHTSTSLISFSCEASVLNLTYSRNFATGGFIQGVTVESMRAWMKIFISVNGHCLQTTYTSTILDIKGIKDCIVGIKEFGIKWSIYVYNFSLTSVMKYSIKVEGTYWNMKIQATLRKFSAHIFTMKKFRIFIELALLLYFSFASKLL